MTNRFFRAILCFGVSLILIGCVSRTPVRGVPPFQPVDLNPRLKSGDSVQKVDQFLVILDASGTTLWAKYERSRKLVRNMNLTIPDLKLKSGLRVFGKEAAQTSLVYGMTDHSRSGFDAAIPDSGGNGQSPLGESIAAAGLDLKQGGGNSSALIIFSDGLETGESSIEAAEALKKQYGNRLCIYAIHLGSSSRGKAVLEGVAKAGQCGFALESAEIDSQQGMAAFVEKVFLAKAPPKPQAAVVPSPPPSPPSPAPKEPPKPEVREAPIPKPEIREAPIAEPKAAPKPKPLDSDGDGVLDDVDKCPGTPRGVKADKEGCWRLPVMYFDSGKWTLKKEVLPALNEVATVLKNNPDAHAVIEGHTDDRGTSPDNKTLSEKRAHEVQNYLVKNGVPPKRLTSKGYGETKPAVPNTSPENMAKNRRVEISLAK